MANGVYIGMSSALASQQRLEVVSNNIANANTTGFKQQRVTFAQFLVDTEGAGPAQKGFTAVTRTVVDERPGAIQKTGNPLDLALDGDSYFAVQGPQGPLLTRNGSFRMREDGTLVDNVGYAVLSTGPGQGYKPIVARPDGGPLRVASDGLVSQGGTPLATLAVVSTNGEPLTPSTGNHMATAPGAMAPVDNPTIAVGFLEDSNVNPVRGMIELIEISQDYQTSQKLMAETRKMDQRVMQVVR